MIKHIITCLLTIICLQVGAQVQVSSKLDTVDYKNPQTYTLAGLSVSGTQFLDKDILIILSGLKLGEDISIPGEKITKAVNSLWKQGLFGDIQISVEKIIENKIFLELYLQERPRLSKFAFNKSLKKGDVDNINDKIKQYKSKIITAGIRSRIDNIITEYYIDKGYWDVKIKSDEMIDTSAQNSVILKLLVNQGKKIKIAKINFTGNSQVSTSKLKKTFKDTKEVSYYNIFRTSKFMEETYEKDKQKLEGKYRELGYRNARIISDSVYKVSNNRINIDVNLNEGNRFYFREISFKGNTIHSDSLLHKLIGIKKGDIFNETILEQRMTMDPGGRDLSSLYMDDGYLFFQANPIELNIENDSIDIEIRITEGAQAIVNKITITGNDKTNDHVILREMRTRPGQKFSRTDIQRTIRELSQLGYFDPEKIGVNPVPNPQDGTVDINYSVTERSNDQVELSGGWGANRVVGSLGLTLNNFSARKFIHPSAWRPIPSGDGQRLSLRAQSNGIWFQSYNASFTEPWFGGKKPNSLSVSVFKSIQNTNGLPSKDPNRQGLNITGVTLGMGKRLKWPDDYFSLMHSANFQQYNAQNFGINHFFQNGVSNNFNIKETLSRSSIDQPIYPRSGSMFTLSLAFTPPYSLINGKDYTDLTSAQRYKIIEYHKWRFDGNWFTKLDKAGKLVLNTKIQFGFLGTYNSKVGEIPFGRFYLGGSGINNFQLDDRELLALRGYKDNAITPVAANQSSPIGGAAFQKYVVELRYPLSLNPSATIWLQTFVEAGNNFRKVKDFDPFNNFRAAGVGVRVFLPMFGLLGLDWGYGFDNVPWSPGANKGNIAISIGQQF